MKYGPNTDISGHSGYTPTDLFTPGSSPLDSDGNEEKEAFQRRKLYNFTSRELVELDAISERGLKTPNLDEVIVPWLGFANWDNSVVTASILLDDPAEPEGYIDDDEDRREFWQADNPNVRKVLTPVLILASRMIDIIANGPLVRI
jgi:hypothetical protein